MVVVHHFCKQDESLPPSIANPVPEAVAPAWTLTSQTRCLEIDGLAGRMAARAHVDARLRPGPWRFQTGRPCGLGCAVGLWEVSLRGWNGEGFVVGGWLEGCSVSLSLGGELRNEIAKCEVVGVEAGFCVKHW